MSAGHRSDRAQLLRFFEEVLDVSRAAGDSITQSYALALLADFAFDRGDYPLSDQLNGEALRLKQEAGDDWGYAVKLSHVGRQLVLRERLEEGQASIQTALAMLRQIGEKWGMCLSLVLAGPIARWTGALDESQSLLQECLALSGELGDDFLMAWTQTELGRTAVAQSEFGLARQWLGTALDEFISKNNRAHCISVADACAGLAVAEGKAHCGLQLAAFVTAQQAANKESLPPLLQKQFDALVRRARRPLAPDVADAAWKAGAAMTLEEAVDYVLEIIASEHRR
jgi:tetratricopeptide (TPR) repeat protein